MYNALQGMKRQDQAILNLITTLFINLTAFYSAKGLFKAIKKSNELCLKGFIYQVIKSFKLPNEVYIIIFYLNDVYIIIIFV